MTIAVIAGDDQYQELTKDINDINWKRISSFDETLPGLDAYVILNQLNITGFKNVTKPILLNSVITTLKEISAPANVIRINGWKSFLNRKQWDIAGVISKEAAAIFTVMGKEFLLVSDTPGLAAARLIAMIINEAYFALEQNVSTKSEIDTAMKLGTNYPFGPFEWATIIGLRHIYDLLHLLSVTDKRYTPSPLLKKEAAL